MQTLRSNDATSPRLTWYGPGGERVELSGRVLDNWVAKTANFLVDELDAGTGSTVLLDLPAHWRGVCWALAGWSTGATLRFRADGADDGGGLDGGSTNGTNSGDRTNGGDSTAGMDSGISAPAEVVATDDPARSPAAGTTVVVALGALEMRWNAALPAGAVDYAAEVRAHADVFFPFAEADGGDTAVEVSGADVTFDQLLNGYATAMDSSERVMLRATGLDRVLRDALGIWAAGGSVVLVHPSMEALGRLAESEKVSHRLD